MFIARRALQAAESSHAAPAWKRRKRLGNIRQIFSANDHEARFANAGKPVTRAQPFQANYIVMSLTISLPGQASDVESRRRSLSPFLSFSSS